MLETLGVADEAAAIEAAVLQAPCASNQVTQDIGGTLGTREAGDCDRETD